MPNQLITADSIPQAEPPINDMITTPTQMINVALVQRKESTLLPHLTPSPLVHRLCPSCFFSSPPTIGANIAAPCFWDHTEGAGFRLLRHGKTPFRSYTLPPAQSPSHQCRRVSSKGQSHFFFIGAIP